MTPAARLAFTIYALFGDLLRDVLDENGEALGDSGEPAADGGHNPVDVAQPGSGSNRSSSAETAAMPIGAASRTASNRTRASTSRRANSSAARWPSSDIRVSR